jgi:hypothetical protein
MKSNLKLFVWEDVLSDYTDGIMFALASSADEAKVIIVEKAKNTGYEGGYLKEIEGYLEFEPKAYEDAVGFFVFGRT